MVNAEKEEKDTLIATYMHLTKEVLPSLARSDRTDWPVSEGHCFQRIVLDTISNIVPRAAVCQPLFYQYYSLSVQTAKFSPYGDAAKLAQPPNYH